MNTNQKTISYSDIFVKKQDLEYRTMNNASLLLQYLKKMFSNKFNISSSLIHKQQNNDLILIFTMAFKYSRDRSNSQITYNYLLFLLFKIEQKCNASSVSNKRSGPRLT